MYRYTRILIDSTASTASTGSTDSTVSTVATAVYATTFNSSEDRKPYIPRP